jgi:hypothetical protein
MTMDVFGRRVSKMFQRRVGSLMKKASVSTKIDFVTFDGRISWMKSFMRPATQVQELENQIGRKEAAPLTYEGLQNDPFGWTLPAQHGRAFLAIQVCRTTHELGAMGVPTSSTDFGPLVRLRHHR